MKNTSLSRTVITLTARQMFDLSRLFNCFDNIEIFEDEGIVAHRQDGVGYRLTDLPIGLTWVREDKQR